MTPSLSILHAAQDCPRAIGVLAEGEGLSYGALASEARRALTWLSAHVRPGERVALLARGDLPTALAFYALAELGVTSVLLHPRLTASERAGLLAQARPALYIEDATAARAAWLGASPDRRAPGLVPDDDRPLALLYTSGTAGAPRGVLLSRAAFVSAARLSASNLGWREDDRWLLCMPAAHVGGFSILTRCLLARRPVVLPRASASLRAMLAQDGATLVSLVPTMLQRLLAEDPAWSPPPSLRAVLLGGAAASAPLLEEAARRAVPVLCTYGLTEACAQVATQRPGSRPGAAGGCGPPLPGVEVRIAAQEIHVRSPSLLSGYDGPGGARDPRLPGGWLPTGDLGRIDEDGNLHVLGRRDEIIITGGENVHPAEVEPALLLAPGVRAACVFGLRDPLFGQIVAAALVADPPPADPVLARFLATRLAPFRRPRRIAYLPSLPSTAAGKPDRVATALCARPLLRTLYYR